jgi:AcrR family transcriptional regulator
MAQVNGTTNRRQQQSALTRDEIVRAADVLFRDRGYVSTTIEAIAEKAGVVVQTIYNSVGNKAAVLNAVLDRTVVGPNAPATVPQFMRERSSAATNIPEVVEIFADWFVEVNPRSAPVFAIIRQAGALDPEVAELERARARQRLNNYTQAAAAARARGGLGAGVTDEQAAASIWSIAHPDTYRALVTDGPMTKASYREWLTVTLGRVLSG